MKKFCPICKNEYKFDWGQYFNEKDQTWYFCCLKCEEQQKLLKNLQKTIDK